MIQHGLVKLRDDKPLDHLFAEPPENLTKVDRKFKCKWIVGQPEGALTWDIVRRLDADDERFAGDALCMCVVMTGTETLPKDY